MIETRQLMVTLDDAQVAVRAHSLASRIDLRRQQNQELEDHLADAKQAAKSMKLQLADLDLSIIDLGATVRTKLERQAVECQWTRNEEAKPPLMELIRTDTGDLVESRPMTIEERQKPLDFPQAAAGGTEGISPAEDG